MALVAAGRNTSNILFSEGRWKSVHENARRWWNHELGRPLIQMTLGGRDPGRPKPDVPYRHFTSYYDSAISAEQIVENWDWDLSTKVFMGDAFPAVWPNFGPGVIAALLGCDLQNGEEATPTVWFHPSTVQPVGEIRFSIDWENKWFQRIRDIMAAAMARWEGQVQVGMTDLGGNLDILSSFRPSENLLFDLVDYPESVAKLTWQAHEKWWRYFEEFDRILRPMNQGYTAWTPIFSEVPYYMLQCDFCYMIGPEMFDRFVKAELAESCRRLGNAFYHLDGPGQLPHLDALLSIDELAGVQWIPGAGSPGITEWPEVYQKIKDAGKLIQIYGDWNDLDVIAEQVGSTNGEEFVLLTGAKLDKEHEAEKFLARWGAT